MSISIQLYNGRKDNKGSITDVAAAIATISGDSLKQQIDKIRASKRELQHLKNTLADAAPDEKEEWQNLVKRQEALIDKWKGDLPGVTWSGTFAPATIITPAANVAEFIKGNITWNDIKNKKSYTERTRSAEQIMLYSGLMCLDIDNLLPDQLKWMSIKLKDDAHTFILFVSPSGNGLKLIVKTDATPDRHKEYFLKLEQHYKKVYGIEVDKSGKDVSRLCFLTWDENIFINENCFPWYRIAIDEIKLPVEKPAQPQKATKLSKAQQTDLQGTDEDLYSVQVFTEKVMQYTEGNRNNFVHLFSCNANRKGFSLSDCLGFAEGTFCELPADEIKATVESAYKNNVNEHGKFKKGNTKKMGIGVDENNKKSKPLNLPEHSEKAKGNSTFTQFWRKHEITKGKGDDAYKKEITELSRVDFSDFLYESGFHLLHTGKSGYQMCQSGNGVIKPVEPHQVKQYVLQWCKQRGFRDVEEMLRKGQKQYFAANELDSLPYKEIDVKKDTKEESYFYFKNCWVSVSADGIKTHQYSELKEYIWEGNKIDKDFTQEWQCIENKQENIDISIMSCEFAKFLYLFAYNPKSDEEKDFEPATINERFWSIATSYGFLLDGYKHPADRKGIFAIDHKIGDKGEQHGRTGKSIIPKAASYLKVTATINGKSFKPDYQFKYEPITRDTQIVNFNDMQRSFDVEQIFEVIADDYSVIRRSNGYVDFTYYDSPKVYYSTNFTPNGEGASYAGRMHVIEASDYFSDTHSPYTEFKRSLFTDWDDKEWNRFFNFSLQCVMALKMTGLVKYPKSNFDMRKLISSVVPEFIDFMDAEFPRNKRVEKLALLEKYNATHYSLYNNKLKPHTFHKWVKLYAKNKLLSYNPHKDGSFDKSNGTEFYVLGDADFKPELLANTSNDLFSKQ